MCLVAESKDTQRQSCDFRGTRQSRCWKNSVWAASSNKVVSISRARAIMPSVAKGLSFVWFSNRMPNTAHLSRNPSGVLVVPTFGSKNPLVFFGLKAPVCLFCSSDILSLTSMNYRGFRLGSLWWSFRESMLVMCVFLNRMPAILVSRGWSPR